MEQTAVIDTNICVALDQPSPDAIHNCPTPRYVDICDTSIRKTLSRGSWSHSTLGTLKIEQMPEYITLEVDRASAEP